VRKLSKVVEDNSWIRLNLLNYKKDPGFNEPILKLACPNCDAYIHVKQRQITGFQSRGRVNSRNTGPKSKREVLKLEHGVPKLKWKAILTVEIPSKTCIIE